jgi:hypothetical protein
MIGAIEGTQGYSEPRLSSALAQVTSRRVFDGVNDESASPWAAVSLAAALFVSCFHTGGIRRLSHFEIDGAKRIYRHLSDSGSKCCSFGALATPERSETLRASFGVFEVFATVLAWDSDWNVHALEQSVIARITAQVIKPRR